jgi:predicted ester cyclase
LVDIETRTLIRKQEAFPMTTEENKATVRRFYSAFEANDWDALNEILSPDLVANSHITNGGQNREVHLQGIKGWNSMFSATRFTVDEQIAEGDLVATRVTMRATHDRGDFQGLSPSGKQIAISGTSIERIRDGKIIERRVNSDWYGILQQLGLVP